MEKPAIGGVSVRGCRGEVQDAVGACAMGAWPCAERRAQLGLSSSKQYLTNRRSCMRLDVWCLWPLVLGKLVVPVTSFRAGCSVLGTKGLLWASWGLRLLWPL